MDDSEVSMNDTATGNREYLPNCSNRLGSVILALDNDLGDHLGMPYTFSCQTKHPNLDTFGVQANQVTITNSKPAYVEKDCSQCVDAVEPYCHVKLDSLVKLKDSTKKLLSLLEEIETSTNANSNQNPPSASIKLISSVYQSSEIELNGKPFNKPDNRPRSLDSVDCEAEADDCSVYKRLTRKCHCLNQFEYNDFIIHFNETTKYFTSTIGEIIKNLRIVKKFVYIGGDYTKHALMFLNEGLTYSTHMEKLDIIQGCAHADVCNVFDDHSIVTVCISWPCNDETHGDATTQSLAASFLNKLAQLEEGRRYLKFSSKITNDLKKVVRKKSPKLEYDILESINDTLNLMQPPLMPHANVTYYCKPAKEGFGTRTVNTLLQYRAYMTLEEVLTHLDLLNNLSTNETGKSELASFLSTLLKLFKYMLIEYDDSEMNIVITNIINNIVTRSMVKPKERTKTVIMAEISTEPIMMKNQTNQVPVKKTVRNVFNKSKQRVSSPTTYRQASKVRKSGWNPSFKKFAKDPNHSTIVVPFEKSKIVCNKQFICKQ